MDNNGQHEHGQLPLQQKESQDEQQHRQSEQSTLESSERNQGQTVDYNEMEKRFISDWGSLWGFNKPDEVERIIRRLLAREISKTEAYDMTMNAVGTEIAKIYFGNIQMDEVNFAPPSPWMGSKTLEDRHRPPYPEEQRNRTSVINRTNPWPSAIGASDQKDGSELKASPESSGATDIDQENPHLCLSNGESIGKQSDTTDQQ